MVSREFAKGCLLGILVEPGLCMSWSVCLFFFPLFHTQPRRSFGIWDGERDFGLHRNVNVERRIVVYVVSGLGTSGGIYSL